MYARVELIAESGQRDPGPVFYAQNYIWLMDPDGANKAQWSLHGPDLSTGERGYGYTTYWIPAS